MNEPSKVIPLFPTATTPTRTETPAEIARKNREVLEKIPGQLSEIVTKLKGDQPFVGPTYEDHLRTQLETAHDYIKDLHKQLTRAQELLDAQRSRSLELEQLFAQVKAERQQSRNAEIEEATDLLTRCILDCLAAQTMGDNEDATAEIQVPMDPKQRFAEWRTLLEQDCAILKAWHQKATVLQLGIAQRLREIKRSLGDNTTRATPDEQNELAALTVKEQELIQLDRKVRLEYSTPREKLLQACVTLQKELIVKLNPSSLPSLLNFELAPEPVPIPPRQETLAAPAQVVESVTRAEPKNEELPQNNKLRMKLAVVSGKNQIAIPFLLTIILFEVLRQKMARQPFPLNIVLAGAEESGILKSFGFADRNIYEYELKVARENPSHAHTVFNFLDEIDDPEHGARCLRRNIATFSPNIFLETSEWISKELREKFLHLVALKSRVMKDTVREKRGAGKLIGQSGRKADRNQRRHNRGRRK